MTAAGRDAFTSRIIQLIKRIPRGKVATYGQIALLAGNHRAARLVARVLHSSSRKERLPWHRVINGQGKVSLPAGGGREEQLDLLAEEGVTFGMEGRLDLKLYLWSPAQRREE